jgi:hypothetical protein
MMTDFFTSDTATTLGTVSLLRSSSSNRNGRGRGSCNYGNVPLSKKKQVQKLVKFASARR